MVELPPMNLRHIVRQHISVRGENHVPLLIQQQYIRTTFEESVCCRKTSKTATNDDNLSHWIVRRIGCEMRWWGLEFKRGFSCCRVGTLAE